MNKYCKHTTHNAFRSAAAKSIKPNKQQASKQTTNKQATKQITTTKETTSTKEDKEEDQLMKQEYQQELPNPFVFPHIALHILGSTVKNNKHRWMQGSQW